MGIQQFTITQDAEGIFRLTGELTILDIEYLKEFLDTTLGRAGLKKTDRVISEEAVPIW